LKGNGIRAADHEISFNEKWCMIGKNGGFFSVTKILSMPLFSVQNFYGTGILDVL
jgi:hypothetical protein